MIKEFIYAFQSFKLNCTEGDIVQQNSHNSHGFKLYYDQELPFIRLQFVNLDGGERRCRMVVGF